jgi:hypothetical protein
MARGHSVTQEVLHTWREAERLLDELHPSSPDRERVRLAADDLRRTYRAVVMGDTAYQPAVLAASYVTTSDARRLLTGVRTRGLLRLFRR